MRIMRPDGDKMSDAVALRIGLFCTWTLDYAQLQRFLSGEELDGPVLKFDIPPPPSEEFKVRTGEGWRDFPLSEIRPMVQKGCSLCEDMTAELADISVGTVEGDEGWNTVIVRTEVGTGLLENAIKDGWLEADDLPDENLDHLKDAARNKRERGRKARIEGLDK